MAPEYATHIRRFERLANAGIDLATLPDQLLEQLERAVAFDSYCWVPIDPRSLLPTSGIGTTIPFPSPVVWEEQELIARNVEPGDLRSMARSGRSVALLSEIVGECKDQSLIYRRVLRPNGLEHQLRCTLASTGCTGGSCTSSGGLTVRTSPRVRWRWLKRLPLTLRTCSVVGS